MMEAARSVPSIDSSRNVSNRDSGIRHHPATVVNLRDVVSQRKQRLAVVMAGPDAEPPAADLPAPGPRRRERV